MKPILDRPSYVRYETKKLEKQLLGFVLYMQIYELSWDVYRQC